MAANENSSEKSAVEQCAVILKLVENVNQKIKSDKSLGSIEKKTHNDKNPDLKTLKMLCWNDDPLTSLTACQGLVSLVHSSCISLQEAFLFLQSSPYSGSVPKGQSPAVLSLLLLDLKAQVLEKNVYENPIKSTVIHPLCRILKQAPNNWKDLLNLMTSVLYHHDKSIRENSLKLLKPLFTFILVENSSSLPETCLHHTWKILVEKSIDNIDCILDYIASPFFQSSSRNSLEICHDVIVTCQLCKSDDDFKSALILVLTSLIFDVLTKGYDPSFILCQLKLLLHSFKMSSSVLLIIISQTISICPAIFLTPILNFCEWLINEGECSHESIWMCVIACLPWLNNCVSLSLMSVHKSIMAIMTEAANEKALVPNQALQLMQNRYLPKIMNFNRNIPLAIHTARFCDELRNRDEGFVVEWLNTIPNELMVNVHSLVETLMCCRREISIRMNALKILQKAPISCASQNLMFFNYLLAKEKDPEIQLELLRSIISTAVDKKNIPHAMQTIKTMQNSGQPVLQILTLELSVQLWLRNELCYPFLLNILTENKPSFYEKKHSIQMDIACAAAIYQICSKAPDKHGKELVQPIQNLLLKCQGSDGAIATSLIMKSLAELIKGRILSPSSTWTKLQPLLDHMQPSVCASMCELVGVAVKQSCTDEVNHSMCSWLWKLVTSSETDYAVVTAALRALKEYNVETMKFQSIPDIFKKNISLPSDRVPSGNLVDAVPGDCWIQFLENVRVDARQLACETIACWLADELKRYRGVYDASCAEPENYNKLPYYSVCKSLYNHLRRVWIDPNHEIDCEVERLILQIFNSKRSKPLPPVSWKFIYNSLAMKKVDECVLNLMANECKTSLSAKTFIKNYLSGENTTISPKFLYEQLPKLANIFNEVKCIGAIYTTSISNEKDDKTSRYYCECLKQFLQDEENLENISEENRQLVFDIVKTLYENISVNDPVFTYVLDCCVHLPQDHVSLLRDAEQNSILKDYKLNINMASRDRSANQFSLLDESIELVFQRESGMENVCLLNDMKKVFKTLRKDRGAWLWAKEHLNRMVKFIEAYHEIDGLDVVCSIFISAVIHFSELSTLSAHITEDMERFYFPLGLEILIDRFGESASDYQKILEKLQVLVKSELLSEPVKIVFINAIQADFEDLNK